MVEVLFLDRASLTALLIECPIWRDQHLIERCRAFAAAVAARAEQFMAKLAEKAQ